MQKFLGWDCANKTLAWSLIQVDTTIYLKLNFLYTQLCDLVDTYVGPGAAATLAAGRGCPSFMEHLRESINDEEFVKGFLHILGAIDYFLGRFISFQSCGVADILRGKKVNDVSMVERTMLLRNFLQANPQLQADKEVHVVIEYQPPKIGAKTNNKSTVVANQLLFYYISSNPVLIDPKVKNTIHFGKTIEEYIQYELPRHKSPQDARYTARKKHSRDNFLHLVTVFNLTNAIKDVPRAVLDDLADSTMQILAHMVMNNVFCVVK